MVSSNINYTNIQHQITVEHIPRGQIVIGVVLIVVFLFTFFTYEGINLGSNILFLISGGAALWSSEIVNIKIDLHKRLITGSKKRLGRNKEASFTYSVIKGIQISQTKNEKTIGIGKIILLYDKSKFEMFNLEPFLESKNETTLFLNVFNEWLKAG